MNQPPKWELVDGLLVGAALMGVAYMLLMLLLERL
jgi:hypothetical protein